MQRLLQTYLDEAAARTPEQQALRFKGQSVTYGELSARSNQLAHALVQAGAQKGDRIGIYLHKSPEAIVGIYGALKAGAVFVPLDPLSPPSRLSRIVEDCGIGHLVTSDRLTTRIETIHASASLRWCIGNTALSISGVECHPWSYLDGFDARSAPDVTIQPEDRSYIFYTSGTTGEPKGMVHTHRSGLAYADWAADEFGLSSTDRVASHAPLHFDLMLFDYFSVARAGACTVLVPENRAKLPASMLDLLERDEITVSYLVPSALVQMLSRGGIENRNLASIRQIIFGGEALSVDHLKEWIRRLPGASFSNVYGVTECNVCTCYHIPNDLDEVPTELPLGNALPTIETAVIDLDGQRVARGTMGELLVAGPNAMQGYWNRNSATARVFVDLEHDNGVTTFLRTGDTVKQLSTDEFVLSGRIDRQVKMRGNRVQLQDVEQALLRHRHVVEASAVPIPGEGGSTIIEAAVVSESELEQSDFSGYLRNELPWYAVPARVWITDSLPRTTAGKIDVRTLTDLIAGNSLESTRVITP